MSTVAIIPARGGSKGLPGKNIRVLAGIPLIAHTIRAAHEARSVDRVVVSTDDDAIAAIGEKYGAEIVRRPAELAGDEASSESALLHALTCMADGEGYNPDLLVFLQCTSPLTTSDDIDRTVAALVEQEADTGLAVARFHHFLWQDCDDDGGAQGVNHDKAVRLRRQDMEPQYLETGSVYVMKTEGFLEHGHRFFGKTVMCEIPLGRVLEIDEPADFEAAERAMAEVGAQSAGRQLPERVGAVVMDFDGVFTDDRVFVDQNGTESVVCSRRDGMGLERMRKAGIPMLVLSKEPNPVVLRRCEKLKLPCLHGIDDKLPALKAWLAECGVALEDAVYIGNDINDIECMGAVGFSAAPSDAHYSALKVADVVLTCGGGRGALRELADVLLARST